HELRHLRLADDELGAALDFLVVVRVAERQGVAGIIGPLDDLDQLALDEIHQSHSVVLREGLHCHPDRGWRNRGGRVLVPLITEGCRAMLPLDTEMSKPTDLVQGTLDLLLLKLLALEPLHGWAISLRLRALSGDVLNVSEGSLYPALHKLEQEGWIKAEWKTTENNRKAKFYALTRLGKKQLEAEAANWKRLSSAISHVVQLSEI